MLIIFDIDGTLVSSYMENRDRAYDGWDVLPDRKEVLASLRARGHTIAIATNQGGVAFGHVSEKEAVARLHRIIRTLELPENTPFEVCFGHPRASLPRYRAARHLRCRKPRGEMLRSLVSRLPEAAKEGALYVGDRPEDEAAALDAGIGFEPADRFFERLSGEVPAVGAAVAGEPLPAHTERPAPKKAARRRSPPRKRANGAPRAKRRTKARD